MREMLDRVHTVLKLGGFLGISFSTASFYTEGNKDPALPKVIPAASDRGLEETLIFLGYAGAHSSERT